VKWFNVDVEKRTAVVAEIGINHNGDISLAKEMIAAAKEAGADAVKFQTLTPEHLFAPGVLDEKKVPFGDEEITLRELFERVSLSDEDFMELKEYAEKIGIYMFSTPFSLHDLNRIDSIGFDVYKVASPDIVFLPLLREMAHRGKPTILSVGTATLEEIDRAVSIFRERGVPLALLYCVSLYPPRAEEVHLRSMQVLMEVYPDIDVGFSDHTIGVHLPIVAITLGAKIIEKHFTIDRSLPGPDQEVSMTPDELRIISTAAKEVRVALGEGGWRKVEDREKENAIAFRRGGILKKNKRAGDIISSDDVLFVRPAVGISPARFEDVVGRRMRRDKKAGEILRWEDLE